MPAATPVNSILVDGGVAADNPTLVAIDSIPRKEAPEPLDYTKVLVLSLGCGKPKFEPKYNAELVNHWGYPEWIYYKSPPLLESSFAASVDMVEFHVTARFKSFESEKNCPRIQETDLTGDAVHFDLATTENMDNLVTIANNLLDKPVSRVNSATRRFEKVEEEEATITNIDALVDFAQRLSANRKLRLGS